MQKPWLQHYTDDIPHEIDIPDCGVPEFLDRAAKRWGQQCALVFFGKRLTYQSVKEAADRFAASLATLGVRKGDKVALLLPNCPQAVIAYYGALKTGAVVVQHNPLYVDRELEFQLRDSESSVLITLDIFYQQVKRIRATTALREIIVTSVKEYLPFPLNLLYPIKAKKQGYDRRVEAAPDVHWLQPLLASAPAQAPQIDFDPASDLAVLQYTGGTTGTPKGAMLTHRNLVANTVQLRRWFARSEEGNEVFLSVLPFFHSFAMTVCLNLPVYLGGAIVIMPQFELVPLLKNVQKHRVTIMPGVPPIYLAINNHPKIDRFDLSSIKFCISGAAPMPEEVQKRFEELTGAILVEGYGLTEASPVTHANPLYGMKKIGSIGVALPSTDCKIVDAETGGRQVGTDEVGELCIRGPQVMKGYWRQPEESAQMIRDGWLHTGDLSKLDADGYVVISERKKDMILVGGFNVYPREVEEILFQHEAVLDVVALGMPHEKMGELVKAYVVLKPGASATDVALIEHCKVNLAHYKVPAQIEFRDQIPKSLIGKPLRRVLRDEMQEG